MILVFFAVLLEAPEAFFILMVMYVTMTLLLSLLLRWWERSLEIPG